ncbi:hypothetical protein CCP3SC1_380005 [Gammaproteobacteria bacterium]
MRFRMWAGCANLIGKCSSVWLETPILCFAATEGALDELQNKEVKATCNDAQRCDIFLDNDSKPKRSPGRNLFDRLFLYQNERPAFVNDE